MMWFTKNKTTALIAVVCLLTACRKDAPVEQPYRVDTEKIVFNTEGHNTTEEELTRAIAMIKEDYKQLLQLLHDKRSLEINVEEIFVSFNERQSCARGSLCSELIPVNYKLSCYLALSPFKQYQLSIHEFGHSYFNYLHPSQRQEFNATAPPYDPDEPLEIMDAVLYFEEDQMEEFIAALERFIFGRNQYAPDHCSNPNGKATGEIFVYCNK